MLHSILSIFNKTFKCIKQKSVLIVEPWTYYKSKLDNSGTTLKMHHENEATQKKQQSMSRIIVLTPHTLFGLITTQQLPCIRLIRVSSHFSPSHPLPRSTVSYLGRLPGFCEAACIPRVLQEPKAPAPPEPAPLGGCGGGRCEV